MQLHMVASVALNSCHCVVWLHVGLLAQVRKTLHLIVFHFESFLRAFVIWLSQLWSKATEEKELIGVLFHCLFLLQNRNILRLANCLMKTKLFIKMMVSYRTRSRFTETYRKAATTGTATHYNQEPMVIGSCYNVKFRISTFPANC